MLCECLISWRLTISKSLCVLCDHHTDYSTLFLSGRLLSLLLQVFIAYMLLFQFFIFLSLPLLVHASVHIANANLEDQKIGDLATELIMIVLMFEIQFIIYTFWFHSDKFIYLPTTIKIAAYLFKYRCQPSILRSVSFLVMEENFQQILVFLRYHHLNLWLGLEEYRGLLYNSLRLLICWNPHHFQ